MVNPYISIIIPIYNSEKHLCKCLDSILLQKFQNWECLLVNDGSTDATDRIIMQYASKDTRFKILDKKNGGVSSARNLGLEKSRGYWVTFVDSDDVVSDNYLSVQLSENVDLVLTDCSYEGATFIETNSNVCGDSLQYFYEHFLQSLQMRTPWAKFYKRELIGDLRFNESFIIGEDTLFVLSYLSKVHRMAITNAVQYLYTPNTDFVYSKYALCVNIATDICSRIFGAYMKLKIRNNSFESFIYKFFFELCKNDEKHLYKWYFNLNVFRLHLRVSEQYDWRYKYSFLKKGLFSFLNYCLS